VFRINAFFTLSANKQVEGFKLVACEFVEGVGVGFFEVEAQGFLLWPSFGFFTFKVV
jgi:hypothetical protein